MQHLERLNLSKEWTTSERPASDVIDSDRKFAFRQCIRIGGHVIPSVMGLARIEKLTGHVVSCPLSGRIQSLYGG